MYSPYAPLPREGFDPNEDPNTPPFDAGEVWMTSPYSLAIFERQYLPREQAAYTPFPMPPADPVSPRSPRPFLGFGAEEEEEEEDNRVAQPLTPEQRRWAQRRFSSRLDCGMMLQYYDRHPNTQLYRERHRDANSHMVEVYGSLVYSLIPHDILYWHLDNFTRRFQLLSCDLSLNTPVDVDGRLESRWIWHTLFSIAWITERNIVVDGFLRPVQGYLRIEYAPPSGGVSVYYFKVEIYNSLDKVYGFIDGDSDRSRQERRQLNTAEMGAETRDRLIEDAKDMLKKIPHVFRPYLYDMLRIYPEKWWLNIGSKYTIPVKHSSVPTMRAAVIMTCMVLAHLLRELPEDGQTSDVRESTTTNSTTNSTTTSTTSTTSSRDAQVLN